MAYLRAALTELARPGVRLERVSSFYETAPVGFTEQPHFLNIVAQGRTRLDPGALLASIQAIERALGRQRSIPWGPRTLDIDILLYGRRVLHRPDLIIPHPRIAERRFVLVPFAEIAPGVRHPVLHRTIRTLLRQCKDTAPVEKYCQV